MNERIKEIRKKYNLSQEKFGEKLGVTKSAISRMELGTYNVTDTMIKLICSNFFINEKWLRTGEGSLEIESEIISLDDYAKQNDITDFELTFIKSYLNIPKDLRHSLEEHFKSEILPNLTNIIINTEDCACEYEDAFNNEKSIEERVAEAEREHEIKVLGKKPEQLDTRDKILNFKPNGKSDKEHA